jgi:hypothetical protein
MAAFRGESATGCTLDIPAGEVDHYRELNGIAEEADAQKKKVDEIMAKLEPFRGMIKSPDISESKKSELKEHLEEMAPIAKANIESAKSTQRLLEQKVSSVAVRTGKSTVDVLKNLAAYHHGASTAKMLAQLEFAQTLDLLFVYDATGSMAPYIKLLHTHIRGILGDIHALNKHIKPRLGLIAYRDPEDGDKHFEIYPFSGKISDFEKNLKRLESEATGGGDQCEDVIGGLQKATEFDWKQQNRIIFLCADAPCHGTTYHDGCGDSHPRGLGIASEPILHELINKGIQIVFWKINDTTDKMIRKFNQEASQCPSERPFPGERPRDEYISIDSMNERNIIESMQKSIFKSVSLSIGSSSAQVKSKSIKHSIKRAAERLTTINEDEANEIAEMSTNSMKEVSDTLDDANGAVASVESLSLDEVQGAGGGKF